MARIGKSLESEFEKKPAGYFTPQELIAESAIIIDLFKNHGSKNLHARYLHYKKVVGVKDQKIVVVLQPETYAKYSKIYSTWASSNLPKNKSKKKLA